MLPRKTARLSRDADDMSPSGASEIRHLLARPAGDLTHVRVPPRSTSGPAVLKDMNEFFLVSPAGSSALPALSSEPNAIAPDGSETRFLARHAQGSCVHCRLAPGLAILPVHHLTVEENWYVLSGRGGTVAER